MTALPDQVLKRGGSRGEVPSRQSWPQRGAQGQSMPSRASGGKRGITRGMFDDSARGMFRGGSPVGVACDQTPENAAPADDHDHLRLGELEFTGGIKDGALVGLTSSGLASWGRLERMRVGIAGKLAQLEEEVVQLQQPLKEPGSSGADAAAGSSRLAQLERLEKGLEEQCTQAIALQHCHAELIEKHRIALEQLSSARTELRGAAGKPAAECAALAHCRAALALLCVATGSLGSSSGMGASGQEPETPQMQHLSVPNESPGSRMVPEVSEAITALVDEAQRTKIPDLCLDVQRSLQAFELRVFGKASAIQNLIEPSPVHDAVVEPTSDVNTQSTDELKARLDTLQQEKEGIDSLLTQLLPLLTSSSAHVLGVTRLVEQTANLRAQKPSAQSSPQVVHYHTGPQQTYSRVHSSPMLQVPLTPRSPNESPRTPQWQSPRLIQKSGSSVEVGPWQGESPRLQRVVSAMQLSPRHTSLSPPPGPIVVHETGAHYNTGGSSTPQRSRSSPTSNYGAPGAFVASNAISIPQGTPPPVQVAGASPGVPVVRQSSAISSSSAAAVLNCGPSGHLYYS